MCRVYAGDIHISNFIKRSAKITRGFRGKRDDTWLAVGFPEEVAIWLLPYIWVSSNGETGCLGERKQHFKRGTLGMSKKHQISSLDPALTLRSQRVRPLGTSSQIWDLLSVWMTPNSLWNPQDCNVNLFITNYDMKRLFENRLIFLLQISSLNQSWTSASATSKWEKF